MSTRYAETRMRSMQAPDMIEPVVQENSRNAAQNTAMTWSPRLGPINSPHGLPQVHSAPWMASPIVGMNPCDMQK